MISQKYLPHLAKCLLLGSFDGKLAIAGDYQIRIVIWDGQRVATLATH